MDNKNTLQERVVQTINRLNVVNDALLKAESDSNVDSAILMFAEFVLRTCCLPCSDLLFFSKLVGEAVMLKGMSSSRLWEKIIENEEDSKKIEGSFKRMDEYTKDFQVLVAI